MDNKVSINVITLNINGFTSSENYMNMLCEDDVNTILCVQEHWLRPAYKNIKLVNQLHMVHPSFDSY